MDTFKSTTASQKNPPPACAFGTNLPARKSGCADQYRLDSTDILSYSDPFNQRYQALETIVQNDAKDAPNRVNLGSMLIQMNKLAQAVARLKEAIALDRNYRT